MKRWLMALLVIGLAALVPVVFVPMAPPAKAASLVQVTNFGNNPSSLQMYIYVPNSVTANPPILLALHGCQGSGPYLYSSTQFASHHRPFDDKTLIFERTVAGPSGIGPG